jgi:type III secretory pathway component EscR
MNISTIFNIVMVILLILTLNQYYKKINYNKKDIKEQLDRVREFLGNNQFIKVSNNEYTNERCTVTIGENYIDIIDDKIKDHIKEYTLERVTLEYFIGILVYNQLIAEIKIK